MPRPACPRHVTSRPGAALFKPAGIPAVLLEEVALTLDELEAIRLADLEGLHQDEAGLRMGISRPTFGRVVESARRKVADALTRGKALRIEGGPVCPSRRTRPRCRLCGDSPATAASRQTTDQEEPA